MENFISEFFDEARTNAPNMFTKVLGPKYAEMFNQVYNASLANRDEKMMDLYDSSKEDASLSAEQKKIITGCYLGYKEAVGSRNVSTPLIAYVATRKPVLSKNLKKKARLKRMVSNLYDLVEETGFDMNIGHFATLLNVFFTQYSNRNIKDEFDGLIIMSALSSFARACGPLSYANKWYIMYYMRNIALLAYAPPGIFNEDPDLLGKVNNIVKTNSIVVLLELKRSGVLTEKDDEIAKAKKKAIDEHFSKLDEMAKNNQEKLSNAVNKELALLTIDNGGDVNLPEHPEDDKKVEEVNNEGETSHDEGNNDN